MQEDFFKRIFFYDHRAKIYIEGIDLSALILMLITNLDWIMNFPSGDLICKEEKSIKERKSDKSNTITESTRTQQTKRKQQKMLLI